MIQACLTTGRQACLTTGRQACLTTGRQGFSHKATFCARWCTGPVRMVSSSGTGDPTPAAAKELIRSLYLSGEGDDKLGQPRIVAVTTGGGGHLGAYFLSEPGASSCLLEMLIPYDKHSCVAFLRQHARSAEGVGFCSPQMAQLQAESALDRAMYLTPKIAQWPDALGVACTATIVSHYQRRGGYRAHCAVVDARGATSVYTHSLIKGARERHAEDAACALLSLRALADACHDIVEPELAKRLTELGILQTEIDPPRCNAVGELTTGVENVPEREVVNYVGWSESPVTVSIPGRGAVRSPSSLPHDAVCVLVDHADAAATAAQTLKLLGRQGDGKTGSWAIPSAPTFFVSQSGDAAGYENEAVRCRITNWAVLHSKSLSNPLQAISLFPGATFCVSAAQANALFGASELDGVIACVAKGGAFVVARGALDSNVHAALAKSSLLRDAFSFLCNATDVVHYDGRLSELYDGSPSTEGGVGGVYEGEWDEQLGCPHGHGAMRWDNGITYIGDWAAGLYHGIGEKRYSKGGGYQGEWTSGKRDGWGTTYYDGKFGYDRWEGPFEQGEPHGVGTMYPLGYPAPSEFEEFDVDGDGVLSRAEVVGRLCGRYGVRREKAEALFDQCDDDGNSLIDLEEFTKHYDDLCTAVGEEFPRRSDQRPAFEFHHGQLVVKKEGSVSESCD